MFIVLFCRFYPCVSCSTSNFLSLCCSHPFSVYTCTPLVNRCCVFQAVFSSHSLLLCLCPRFVLCGFWFVFGFIFLFSFIFLFPLDFSFALPACCSHFGFWILDFGDQLIIKARFLLFYLPASACLAIESLFAKDERKTEHYEPTRHQPPTGGGEKCHGLLLLLYEQ